jgi:hypothetical protein
MRLLSQADSAYSYNLLSHPVCRRPARQWSGRGPWRPGGARHCTNDLDARDHARSACPGSMAGGMGAPAPITTTNPRSPAGPRPSRSLSAPAGGIVLASAVRSRLMPSASPIAGARGAGRAERGGDMSDGAAGRRTRARRSGSDAGFLSKWRQVSTVPAVRAGLSCGLRGVCGWARA